MSDISIDKISKVYPCSDWIMTIYRTSLIIDTITSSHDMIAVYVLQKLSSVNILKLLKMFPSIRKIFKKHAKMLPLKFLCGICDYYCVCTSILDSDSDDNNDTMRVTIPIDDLKYVKNAYSIDLTNSRLSDNNLVWLKKVNTINISKCSNIFGRGFRYLKKCQNLNISSFGDIRYIKYLKSLKNVCLTLNISFSYIKIDDFIILKNLRHIIVSLHEYKISQKKLLQSCFLNLETLTVIYKKHEKKCIEDLKADKLLYKYTFDLCYQLYKSDKWYSIE